MTAPCATISVLSAEAGAWRAAQEAVGEESQTDWLLYTLARDLPFVQYLKFTRHQEARHSGADWDWVFAAPRETIIWRVQAKKLTAGIDHYAELARTNQYGLQIETLIQSAEAENRLPVYAFYRNPARTVLTACQRNRGAGDGVILADAYEVYELVKKGRMRVEADHLAAISVPLSCVLCCPLTTASGLASLSQRYFTRASARTDPAGEQSLAHFSVPPAEFRTDRAQQPRLKIPSYFEGEFRQLYSNVQAVLLFDLWDIGTDGSAPVV